MPANQIRITNEADELTAIITPRADGLFAVSFWNAEETCSLGFARICATLEAATKTAREYAFGAPGPISLRIL